MSFPNFKNKHSEDAVFNPKEFMDYRKKNGRGPKKKAPEGMIFCYQKKLMEYIIENHEVTLVDNFYGPVYLINETNGRVGIAGNFGIGSPVAATLLEELIAWGVKRFISIGTAGTLQKEIKIGEIMVCDKSIRDEGTSHHYLKPSKYAYASKEMTQKIKDSLEKLNQKYFVGTSWTIDAPYRETVGEARTYQKEGVSTVEMEASALFAVAQYRNIPLGAIFTISDSLAELKWKPKFHIKKTGKSLETLYKVSVDALMN